MFNSQWDVLFVYFTTQHNIYQKFTDLDFEQQIASAICADDVLPAPIISLANLQLELANNLQVCHDMLTTLVDADNCRYVVDALAFHCDEIVLTQKLSEVHIQQETLEQLSRSTALLKLSSHWSKLQTRFSQCNHGGEMFFINLDKILAEPEHQLFSIEVYYFCLKQGFVGRFLTQQPRIEDYQQHCIKILQQHTPFSQPNDDKRPQKNEPLFGVSHAASA